MTTILTTPQHTTPTHTPEQAHKRTHTAVIVIAVAALIAALAGLGVAVSHWVADNNATNATAPTAFPYEAFGPGSTVYREQVPTVDYPNTALFLGYGPASTVYREQVPRYAEPDTSIDRAFGYGATTYREQVPKQAAPPPAPHQAAPFE